MEPADELPRDKSRPARARLSKPVSVKTKEDAKHEQQRRKYPHREHSSRRGKLARRERKEKEIDRKKNVFPLFLFLLCALKKSPQAPLLSSPGARARFLTYGTTGTKSLRIKSRRQRNRRQRSARHRAK